MSRSELNSGFTVKRTYVKRVGSKKKPPKNNKVIVKHVGCKACSGSDVARSRGKGIDKIINTILPLATFRCLGCYERFWSIDTFFGNKLRVLLWLLALIALVLLNSNLIKWFGSVSF